MTYPENSPSSSNLNNSTPPPVEPNIHSTQALRPYGRRASDLTWVGTNWRVAALRILLPFSIVVCFEQAFVYATQLSQVLAAATGTLLLAGWLYTWSQSFKQKKLNTNIIDTLVLGPGLLGLVVAMVLLLIFDNKQVISNLQVGAWWVPMLSLYAGLIWHQKRALLISFVASLLFSLYYCHYYALQHWSIPILGVTPLTFFSQSIITASIAIIISQYHENIQGVLTRYKEAQAQSLIDALTGLPNRRNFSQDSESLWQNQRLMSLFIIDVDHFSAINEQYGHSIGDQVLQQLGRTLQSTIPAQYKIYRWGGEEFVICAPCTIDTALPCAKQLRSEISHLSFPLGIALTVSVGIAQRETIESLNTTFIRADQALYDAKKNGRNRVEISVKHMPENPIDRRETQHTTMA